MEVEEEIKDYTANGVYNRNWKNKNGGFIQEKIQSERTQDKAQQNFKKPKHRIFETYKITTFRNHTGHQFGENAKSKEDRIVNGYVAGMGYF